MTSILIVDDDPASRTTIGRELGAQGFLVALARSADEATEILAGHTIDVLLADLRLPGAGGIDLLARARTVAPRTRVILMSGDTSARDHQRAFEYGAVRVLSTPFTPRELRQAIRQAVECETGVGGSIDGLSLVELLPRFHGARRSLAIVVDGQTPGRVFLEDGEVVHAVYRKLQGEPALRAILAMPAGALRTTELPPATPHSITRDLQILLRDWLPMIDDATAPPADREVAERDEARPGPRRGRRTSSRRGARSTATPAS